MTEYFFEELKGLNEKERKEMLANHADHIAEDTFTIAIPEDELEDLKTEYFREKSKVEDLDERISEIKADKKPHLERMKALWPDIRMGRRVINGKIYGFKDFDNDMIVFYTEEGHEVRRRRMTAEDGRQRMLGS